MSYFVGTAKKFKANDIRGLQIHFNREAAIQTNDDIDLTRSGDNYDLSNWSETQTFKSRWKHIIKTGHNNKNAIRKDAVGTVSIVVTSDRAFFDNLSPEETKKFFEVSYKVLNDYFGEKNVISAMVHMDETTPHMHYAVVPLTKDGRLSAKEVVNRDFLTKLQDIMPENLQDAGFDIERGIKGSKRTHLSVQDFKATFPDNSYKKQQEIMYAKRDEIEKELTNLLSDTSSIQKEIEKDLIELGNKLASFSGKMVYGYFPEEIKREIDTVLQIIVDKTPILEELLKSHRLAFEQIVYNSEDEAKEAVVKMEKWEKAFFSPTKGQDTRKHNRIVRCALEMARNEKVHARKQEYKNNLHKEAAYSLLFSLTKILETDGWRSCNYGIADLRTKKKIKQRKKDILRDSREM